MVNDDYQRPDPETLLKRIEAEAESRHEGKLRLFLGYAAGVGKTYAMLEAAQQRQAEEVDVVVAYIETHGRAETDALLSGLEIVPRQSSVYRNIELSEMDLEAVLARQPQIALVDELAHSNIPNSTHRKRYQNVEALLNAGIDVYTTLNVQHIESLNDVVEQITGVAVRETIPDYIIERADEIELIDILPEDLLERLDAGKVYVPEQAERAIRKFFRPGNLTALREIAMRQVANRVDHQMRAYMQSRSITGPWAARERIMVAISPNPISTRLVRTGSRLCQHLDADFFVVYIENPSYHLPKESVQKQINETLRLAENLGAKVVTVAGTSIPETLMRVARENNVTKIVIGQTLRSRWHELRYGSIVNRLIRLSGDVDIYVISSKPDQVTRQDTSGQNLMLNWMSYLYGIGMVLLATILSMLIDGVFDLNPTNLVMVYLLAIVIASIRFGYGTAVLVSLLSVVSFNFSFVPPRYTFRVADTEYLLTFIGLASVGIFTAYMASQIRNLAVTAQSREQQTARLYALSRDLSTAVDLGEIVEILVNHSRQILNCEAIVFLQENNQFIIKQASESYEVNDTELSVANWAYDHQQQAGRGTRTLPSARGYYIPLKTAKQTVGVFGIQRVDSLFPVQERLLDAFAAQSALALETNLLSEKAREAELNSAKEKLQSTILNSVSHDLRTPLVSIKGTLSSLLEDKDNLSDEMQHDLLSGAYNEVDRLNRLVGNLLEISRLQSGAVQIRREPYEVAEIITVARNQLQNRLQSYDVKVSIDPHLPLLKVDLTLFAQVIVNLLDNAAKYSSAGQSILIRAYQSHEAVCIEVADQGIGIPEAELPQIFDKFFRASTTGAVGGSGLGLSIARGIVDLHQGTIQAENRPQGGVLVSIKIPLSETLAIADE
jgi:two-component system sensor histidine kinase KdpD